MDDLPSTVSEVVTTTSVAHPTPNVPGYLVGEMVGRGGMGRVYRARHATLGRTVAIKVLAHEPDDKLLARFREEARSVAKLQHPNIAQLYESGTADGRPFYAQEFVDGGTLAEKLGRQPQDPQAAARLVETVARAIHYSHDNGILHRDLKPGNILLTSDGTPKVTDFGLAKELQPTPDSSAAGLTRTGEIVGTPAYMPPEQASGVVSGLGPPTDVYSLGAILYEMLTGRPPFQSPEPLQTLLMVLSMEPVPPRTLLPKLPKDLETICLKCLEKTPKKRYATAAALADDLRHYLAGEPIVARPVGWVERTTKWAARKPASAALAGVSVLFALAVVAFAVLSFLNFLQLRKMNRDLEQSNNELVLANAELEKSKGETETMLSYALGTLDEYHFTLSDKLRELPHGEKLRVEVLKRAQATLDEMYDANPKREKVVDHLMVGYQQLGNALAQIGDLSGAEQAYRRAKSGAERLEAMKPDLLRARTARGIAALQLALVLTTLGKTAEVDALNDEGEKLAAELEAAHPDDENVLRLCLLATNRAALRTAATGKTEGMAPFYRRWAELYRRLAAIQPDVPKHLFSAVENELALARLLGQQKQYDDAERLLTRSRELVDKLTGQSRIERSLRATYFETLGNQHYNRDQPTEADAAYRSALAEYDALVKEFPNSPNYRRMLVNTWFSIGCVWSFGGKPDVGADAWKKARQLAADLVRDYPDDLQMKDLLGGIDKNLKGNLPPEKK